jgi:hypothetical protein
MQEKLIINIPVMIICTYMYSNLSFKSSWAKLDSSNVCVCVYVLCARVCTFYTWILHAHSHIRTCTHTHTIIDCLLTRYTPMSAELLLLHCHAITEA